MNVLVAVLPCFLVSWHFTKFSVASRSLSVSFHQKFFPETLQVFVASHLQVSFFTFYEKCWCLDLHLCLDFYIITDMFFQSHHLSQQTWLRTIQFVYVFCSTSLLNCYSSILIVLSSVELVKILSSNLDSMAYLVVLYCLLPYPRLSLFPSCFLNTASSTTSDLSKCLPFPYFWHCIFLKPIIKMLFY